MRLSVADHRLSVDPGDAWAPDPSEPGSEHLGLYLRSLEHGIYLNVREQGAGSHALTKDGLTALLHEQNWGRLGDEWSTEVGALVVVAGTFEATGMGGDVVLEVFLTDGKRVANFAGPGAPRVIAALRPAVERLAATVHFD